MQTLVTITRMLNNPEKGSSLEVDFECIVHSYNYARHIDISRLLQVIYNVEQRQYAYTSPSYSTMQA